ncbi:MAG: substrate-binding domain-containing protein [Flavisolibacter sp.]|nr:substrate-binding domain-containing protein [Flavisolibacter sp.]
MLTEMKRELAFYPNVRFIYRQADANSQKQVEQVKELLQEDIDLLIISPNEAEPLTPVVEEAFNKGIPVIVVDRKIASSLYTAYVGGDNYEVGKMAGEYAVHLLNGKGKVIEITGLPKSSAAIERQKGFSDALKNYPYLHVVQQLNGEWIKPKAKSELSKAISQDPDIDLVFAQNDMMALGTYEVYKNKGAINKPKIIGVDGLPGNGLGMQFVTERTITATMLYPTGGAEAIRIAMQILNGQSVQKENLLQTSVIDSTNVRLMQLQAEKITSQQQQIERQQSLLNEQIRLYNSQRTFLYILVTALILVLTLGGISLYSLRENRKMNRKLQLQNKEILEQKREIEEMSAKAQAANEAKVNFFTNISHEFRTPLTLILGPLEELLACAKNHSTVQSLTLIQKNAIRLLRLVNQLMDFRKIEVEKMKIRASEENIITFLADIVQSYKSIAQQRKIDLHLITKERQLNVWFDTSLLDKVIFNLLSNAFKFTGDNGFVHVYIEKSTDGNEVVVKVEDNGVGMTQDAQEHAFDVFYQGEYENYKGSGLGLALSKEIIRLHKGSIAVCSKKWEGASFEIRMPLGNAHLEKEEMVESEVSSPPLHEQEQIYLADLEGTQKTNKELEGVSEEKEHSILIIEDNPELRDFLVHKFNAAYEVLEADNGQTALQQAFNTIPDIIICDVVISGKDGMALTNILKNDIRTSHIPIILLTAITSIEQQIEGMRNMADAYITKPFNMQFLEQTVKSLLANRTRLKEHFAGDISSNIKTQTLGKLDRKFINEFKALVESNLSNEDFDLDKICKTMGISKMQLYRKVKALLNMNAHDYILSTRLQKAKYLLQHEESTISEVAYKVGFSSPAYFSTVFKSKFGVTPKTFKEK